MTTTASMSEQQEGCRIRVLPKEVVDRIAAGEVVQRPVSVIKELLENALDASANQIQICADFDKKTCRQITVSDNGCGISKQDLAAACMRHATSKLESCQDFDELDTFGFRGEALAAVSMVSRLTITTKRNNINNNDDKTQRVAYQLAYRDGKPVTDQPRPVARPPGTTVCVQDLFYNVPHRQTACAKGAAEYNKILTCVQHYAVQTAERGIGLVCRKAGGVSGGSRKKNNNNGKTDLNTTTLASVQAVRAALVKKENDNNSIDSKKLQSLREEATKQVIGQVFGSQIVAQLRPFSSHFESRECGSAVPLPSPHSAQEDGDDGDNKQKSLSSSTSWISDMVVCDDKESKNSTSAKDKVGIDLAKKCSYRCRGFFSAPGDHQAPLYSNRNNNNSGNSRKTQFILFVNNRLVEQSVLKRGIDDVYADFSSSKSKPFVYLSLQVPADQVDVNCHPTKREVALLFLQDICNHVCQALRGALVDAGQTFAVSKTAKTIAATVTNPYNNKKRTLSQEKVDVAAATKDETAATATKQGENSIKKAKKTAPLPPSKMIRTSRGTQAGALEPYLVPTQSQSSGGESTSTPNPSQDNRYQQKQRQQHRPDCPLFAPTEQQKLDLSQPGAFAKVAALCRCNDKNRLIGQNYANPTAVRTLSQSIIRPKKVVPTTCEYLSIQKLRKRIHKRADSDVEKMLRTSCFVGCVSQERSILQCGQEVVMLNHYLASTELFYQLALFKFKGGATVAKFGKNEATVDIQTVIAQSVQTEQVLRQKEDQIAVETNAEEEILQGQLAVSETNKILAEQAAACLWDQSEMLLEYFSILIEREKNGNIVLKGLPVLLEGHAPPLHGLPLFLLRLATEVDYEQEAQCFHGICRELGFFYALSPATTTDDATYVRHTLFPAVTTLLIPSKQLKAEQSIISLTKLEKLYKGFERC